MRGSTMKTSLDPTLTSPRDGDRELKIRQQIWAEWRDQGESDIIETLRRHPELLAQRSLLLELVLDEYESRRENKTVDLAEHCNRFRKLGESFYHSVQRQLAVHRFCEESDDEPNWPEPGAVLGGFDIEEQLGTGATARVYLCREREIGDRRVVLKVSRDTTFEASILGRLQHPHITPVYSAGFFPECELHYLCMPYLGRRTLADLVLLAFHHGIPKCDAVIRDVTAFHSECPATSSRRWLSQFPRMHLGTYVDSIVQSAIQMAGALEFAHERTVLHGDLKPSNVLLTSTAEPVLLDFNLSQDYAQAGRLCGGTLPYMPPEHLRRLGSTEEPENEPPFTPTSDIYSFGALLYELFTGLPPVNNVNLLGDFSETVAAICERLERGIRDIRSFNPYVSHRLSELVARCLSLEPKDRPATIGEVKRLLRLERYAWSALLRRVRVRPAVFSFVLGVPLAAVAASGWYVATLPPQYERDYQVGLKLAAANQLQQAAASYAAAARANPTYAPARFELGRTRLRLGEINAAINEFDDLERNHAHVPSLAYLAYCYDLQQMATVAIPLYERAIQQGVNTAAVHNNLAASYIDGSSYLSQGERFHRSESHLDQACSLAPNVVAIRLNYLRLAVRQAAFDRAFNPYIAWPHAQHALQWNPSDKLTRHVIGVWWSCVLSYEQHRPADKTLSPSIASSTSPERTTARQEFAAIYEAEQIRTSVDTTVQLLMNRPLELKRYYLEPAPAREDSVR